MELSKASRTFIDCANASGAEKYHMVFPADVLEQVYLWEREEVEDIIWGCFSNRDFSFIEFLPSVKQV